MKSIDKNIVINEAVAFGVDKKDAELLSYFYNDGELIYDILHDKEEAGDYEDAKKAFVEFMDALKNDDKREAIYYAQTNIIPLVKTKSSARFFLDMLVEGFEDVLNIQQGKSPMLQSYDTILQELSKKLPNVSESLIEILKDRNLINLNVNTSLLMDHLVLHIIKE